MPDKLIKMVDDYKVGIWWSPSDLQIFSCPDSKELVRFLLDKSPWFCFAPSIYQFQLLTNDFLTLAGS